MPKELVFSILMGQIFAGDRLEVSQEEEPSLESSGVE
jgi:hypothetical protein